MTDKGNLVLGRGSLYLDLFNNGIANGDEIYLGNTPGFTTTIAETASKKYQSTKGVVSLVDRYVTRREVQCNITCDEMTNDNVALWFGSSPSYSMQAAITSDVVETFPVKAGRYYQIGVTDDNPLGERHVTEVRFKVGATTIDESGNIDLNSSRGRFRIYDNLKDLSNGQTLTVRYQRAAYRKWDLSAPKTLEGSLRYISRNANGPETDVFFPSVSIEPQGTFEWKTDDWAQIKFTMTARKVRGRDLYYISREELV